MDMMEAVASFEGRIAKVCGSMRTGKTEALVRRCAALLARGEDPAGILVVASTAEAAAVLRRRIEEACADRNAECTAPGTDGPKGTLEPEGAPTRQPSGTGASTPLPHLQVTTAQNACLSVLDAEPARQATGRVPRTLTNSEYNFFLEDMKTLGIARRRLRQFMRRLQRQWCALVPESEWLLPGDEQHTLDFALIELKSLGAMLPDEAPWLCATYLQSEEGRAAAQQYDYVLCDDFQNLSRAQQTSLCLMARNQVIVTGNAAQTTRCAAPFPNPQGFERFDELRSGVETFRLDTAFGNPRVTAFVDAIAQAGDENALQAGTRSGAEHDVMLVKWNTPEEEMNGIARYVRSLVESDAVQHEGDIAVVAPNKRWAKMLEASLRSHGLEVSAAAFTGFSGDPRDFARAAAPLACTKLNLLANPQDMVAWRCWCGYGNYLTNSDAWSELSAYAEACDLPLLPALEQAAKEQDSDRPEPFLRAWDLVKRYREGRDFIEKNAARRGFALLKAVGADNVRDFSAIRQAITGEEDAAMLYAAARRAQLDPENADAPHAVHLTSYEMLAGCAYEYVIVCGCVDGLVPPRDAFEVVSTEKDRQRIIDQHRRAFSTGVAKAQGHLVLSTFRKANLELAETVKMQVTRVRFEDDTRMAMLRPTCYLAEAKQACPPTASGQALLASLDMA